MTHETRQTETDAPGRKNPPGTLRLSGLWTEAREWMAWLLAMFDSTELRTKGLTRAHGVRLSVWLQGVEGAVRRLVLAAALTLSLPAPRRPRACPAATAARRQAIARRPGFCVFRLRGLDAHGAAPHESDRASPSAPVPSSLRPFGHIPFPSDPLLSLGEAPARLLLRGQCGPRGLRRRNPLDRWVKPCRQDPDWRPPEDKPEDSDANSLPCPAQRASSAPRLRKWCEPHDPNVLPASLADWRRCHDEWERLVPARELAARLEALERVIADPAAVITAAARRIRHVRRQAIGLAHAAAPVWRRPRHAARVAFGDHTGPFARRCHHNLVTPDTS